MGGNLEKIYRESDAGARAELTVGEPFVVRLPENPTTGFHWELGSWDRAVVELVDDSLDSAGKRQVGAAAEHAWRFLARTPGTVTLRFDLRRRWRSDAAAGYQLEIGVAPARPSRPRSRGRDD